MRTHITATGMARGMNADMPEQARKEFGRKIDDYDRALRREIALHLTKIVMSEGG